ncbi:MAG: hypothetical protein KBF82_04420 [Chitinophagaceae bacterium]|nr:hypothetical protein [Chitinophagaceae bacterium]
MKKLLLGSIALTLFAISVTLFQISCQKEVEAQTTTYTLPPATTTTLGGVIVGNGLSVTPSGVLSLTASGSTQLNLLVYYKIIGAAIEIWTAKYDGTTQTKINLTLPANTEFSDDVAPQLSPDGTKIFFTLQSTVVGQDGTDLYSANINGTGVTKIIDKGGNGNYITLGGVY